MRGILYTSSEPPDVSSRQAILHKSHARTYRHIPHAARAKNARHARGTRHTGPAPLDASTRQTNLLKSHTRTHRHIPHTAYAQTTVTREGHCTPVPNHLTLVAVKRYRTNRTPAHICPPDVSSRQAIMHKSHTCLHRYIPHTACAQTPVP